MGYLKKNIEFFLLLFVIVVAAAMRFYNYNSWSLSNDELSALSRRNFGSFTQLINEGVRPDFHPGGVQVFLYFWVKIFGDSEAALRFPFVICGIFSVLLVYLIGKKWFSASAGLLSALALAFLQFPILYSQLARPYSPGLLFSLLNVYFWTLLIFDFRKYNPLYIVLGYSISTVLCMYTHYFCFLFAIITGITGLFLLTKENARYFFSSAVIAVLLFLPHLSISIEQFSREGLGSWLGKPEDGYFMKFVSYSINDSLILESLLVFTLIISLILYSKEIRSGNKFRLISIIWFITPYFIGYYYSIYKNPVLQYSILLFSFPFLLLFVFSFFNDHKKYVTIGVFLVLGGTGIWSTTTEKHFYSTSSFGTFKELAQSSIEWDKKYGKENITTAINCISYDYINYYFKKYNYKPNFSYFRGDDVKSVGDLQKSVRESKTKYFVYGWTNAYSPYAVYELIKEKYPKIVEERIYFNSRISIFEADSTVKRDDIINLFYDFEKNDKYDEHYDTTVAHSGETSWKIDSLQEFSSYPLQFNVKDLFKDSVRFLNTEAWIYSNVNASVHLVIEFSNKDGVYEWQSAPSDNFSFEPGKWCRLFYTEKIPVKAKPDDTVKIYIWNPNKNSLYLDDVKISSYKDMNYNY